jgi:hypothetical protein
MTFSTTQMMHSCGTFSGTRGLRFPEPRRSDGRLGASRIRVTDHDDPRRAPPDIFDAQDDTFVRSLMEAPRAGESAGPTTLGRWASEEPSPPEVVGDDYPFPRGRITRPVEVDVTTPARRGHAPRAFNGTRQRVCLPSIRGPISPPGFKRRSSTFFERSSCRWGVALKIGQAVTVDFRERFRHGRSAPWSQRSASMTSGGVSLPRRPGVHCPDCVRGQAASTHETSAGDDGRSRHPLSRTTSK